MKKRVCFVSVGIFVSLVGLSGCMSQGGVVNKSEYDPVPIGKIIWSTHDKRPGWSVSQKDVTDGEKYYFVGHSEKMPTETMARSAAELEARAKASKYVGTRTDTDERTTSSYTQRAGKTAAGTVKNTSKITAKSDTLMSRLHPEDWYITLSKEKDGTEFFQAFVLMSVPAENADSAHDFNKPKEEIPAQDMGTVMIQPQAMMGQPQVMMMPDQVVTQPQMYQSQIPTSNQQPEVMGYNLVDVETPAKSHNFDSVFDSIKAKQSNPQGLKPVTIKHVLH